MDPTLGSSVLRTDPAVRSSLITDLFSCLVFHAVVDEFEINKFWPV
jgi:hypothetical protein